MSTWKDIWKKAEQAKRVLIASTAEGERQFDTLLRVDRDDGMIYLQRARAREAVGNTVEASEDYQKALNLMPMPRWQNTAREGLERCRSANLREQPSDVPITSVPDEYENLPSRLKAAWRPLLSSTGMNPQKCIHSER